LKGTATVFNTQLKINTEMKSLILLFVVLFFASNLSAQIYPVSLESRIENSSTIAIATLKSKHSYWDQYHHNIYTLNVMEVTAYPKGQHSQTEIAIITEGGVVGNEAQKNYPETKINPNFEYCVFLIPEDFDVDDKIYRSQHPNTIQCKAVARIQGALPFQDGKYRDVFDAPKTEAELLDKIEKILKEKAKKPNGSEYIARNNIIEKQNRNLDPFTITSVEDGNGTMAPGPFIAGTIVTTNELILKASAGGFGATQGTGKVEFANADDGGATMIEPPNASDYVSWADDEIRVKIPSDAGTGDIKVTDDDDDTDTWDDVSDAGFTIKWAMNVVDSDFYLWGSDNRNRVELVEDNAAGGYTMEYSTVGGMDSNTDAKDAFERALTTWRCETFINIDVSATATSDGFADDGTNVVMFASLSGSTLGVATSRYAGSGTGTCDMEDTFWRLKELDIRFDSGTTWYYGSGACTGTKYDFESVAVHELGHGHGLGHINDDTKVMYFSISNCEIVHDPHVDEVAAGDHKMDHSETANCLGPPTYPDVITPVTMGDCSLLPVELISFDGKLMEKAVKLAWQSATEINNDFFTLERSLDGRNYETIAIVKGQSTSYENHSYEYFDENPLFGVNYYRLTQTDFDGTFEVFDKILAIEYISDVKVKVYPNPVIHDQFQLAYNSNQGGALQVEIYSVAGKILYQENFRTRKDLNYFDISLSGLSDGIYIVKTNQNNFVENIRFVKTN
jgi:hypothetical protein